MITFSSDSRSADEQVRAILFYLTTFGYIDGDFDLSEKEFIEDYIRQLAEERVASSGTPRHSSDFPSLVEGFRRRYQRTFERIDRDIQDMFEEAIGALDDLNGYVYGRLKVRCYEIFQNFDEDNQGELLEAAQEFIAADGVLHPAEIKFRDELVELLNAEIPVFEEPAAEAAPAAAPYLYIEGEPPPTDEIEARDIRVGLTVNAAIDLPVQNLDHPLLEPLERHYSADKPTLMQQTTDENGLIRRALSLLAQQRGEGLGKLTGKQTSGDLLGEMHAFLDDRIYVIPPRPGKRYELIVLGDLHGCYSCLKGALMQTDFFNKVEAYRRDPANNPHVKLILLGDYIDRGLYSFHGCLRAALALFTAYPDHVFLLRGNHEYFLEKGGGILPGVAPAEAITSMLPHWPQEQFKVYKRLFDELPHMLIFDKFVFVHAGIPRDETIEPIWEDIDSLNDKDASFQMIWSDPSDADYIPRDLQRASVRFPFGKMQWRSFMRRLGVETMIRGHEKVDGGILENYNFEGLRLYTLFSAGGAENKDLPPQSSYRGVTPMGMTITWEDLEQTITPWAIRWEPFNEPANNGFYRNESEGVGYPQF